jgi:transcription antitermination factor NusG
MSRKAVSSAPMPSPFWAVVRSQPQRERFASEQLGLRGFETFLPMVATKRASAPLFNSYFFVRIVEQWRSINFCFGVLCLVRVRDCPARCPEHEIEALKSRLDASGVIRLSPPPPKPKRRAFTKGERVKVIAGGARFDAIHTGMTRRARELILIAVLGGRREIEVSSHLVEAAP